MYIDAVYVYCRLHTGGPSTLRHAIYKSNGAFQGQAPNSHSWTTTDSWTHSEWNAGSFLHLGAGLLLQGAVLRPSSGGLQVGAYNDGGSFNFWQGITSFPTTSGWGTKSWGSLPWYLTYFPVAQVTGYKIGGVATTIAHPGDRLEIDGRSFNAGVTAISFNGTAANMGSINQFNDNGLNIDVPLGATTGPVTVTTNAGVAVGPTLTISGGRVFHSNALVQTVSARVFHNNALVTITRLRVAKNVGGTLTLVDAT